MTKLSKFLLFIISFSICHSAQADSSYIEKFKTNVQKTWNVDTYEAYVPVWTWHNRATYDKYKTDDYNETPWGFGIGKSRYDDDGDWHGLYVMAFKDSNSHVQTIGGYAFQKNWALNEAEDLKVGAGFTLSLTQREELYYIPVPLPLPLIGATYKRFSIQAAYVPGVHNNGNVMFTWLRWQIN